MGSLVLQTRHRKLLSLLQSRQRTMSGRELSAQLDVTPRTIRSDVKYLNGALAHSGICIHALRGKGYQLDLTDGGALQPLLDVGVNLQSREERARYLTLLLALADHRYCLDDLEDCLFVSRTTLEHDLRFVQEAYGEKPPYLRIRRRANEVWAEVDERKRRVALSRLFVENWESHAHSGINAWDSMLEPEDFALIQAEVTHALEGQDFSMDDYGLMDVVFTIAIAHMRVQGGFLLDEAETGPNIDPRLMDIANQMVDHLEEKWGLPLNYPEREEIAHTLQIRQSFAWKFRTRHDLTRYVRPSRIAVAQGLLEEIRALYGEDLTGDDELFVSLVRHIAPLVARIRFKFERQNYILRTVKTEYPLAMDYAVLFQKHFYSRFQYALSEDELSFIAVHLQLALDRKARGRDSAGVPAAFVTHVDPACSQLMMSQIRAVFGSALDLRGPFPVYEEGKISASAPRLILSTVRLDGAGQLRCPVLTISSPLSDGQILQINHALRRARRSSVGCRPLAAPGCYCAPALYFPDLEADTQEKVLHHLLQALEQEGCTGEAFRQAVLERERISSTAFEPGLAIPHPLRISAPRSAVAAARLKRPVWWGGQKVQFVLLPALSQDDLPAMGRFLALGTALQQDKRLFDQLLAARSASDFYALLDGWLLG